ncbi:MAG: hypothetical protein K8F90_18435 [Hyphomicrobiales bacterium]|nr:hypothetical protein [Hyphomicrobiales bacterium]
MKLLIAAFLSFWLLCLPAMAAPADTTARFDQNNGLFVLRHHTVDVVTSNFLFFSGNWAWRGLTLATETRAPFEYDIGASNKETGLVMKASARRSAANRLEWRLRVDPGSSIYGGMSVKFDLSAFAGGAFVPEPELLPGGDGWMLRFAADEEPVKFMVSPTPSKVVFERGQKGEVRVYFATSKEELVAGDYTMTLELPAGGTIEPTSAERLGRPDTTWYNDLLDLNNSPVDLSFLNAGEKPAGKRGQLSARGDQLVFANGTPARFWGTNVSAYSLFHTGLSDTVSQAKRLSKLGFNLVRLHHFDSAWVKPNILGKESAAGLELDADSLRRLDWWIKALGDEGIYVWLDLNVGRVFLPEGLTAAEEMAPGQSSPTAQGYSYINRDIEARMKDLNRLLLTHVNQYTNLAYKDDPRIAFLLLTNENDMTHHFGNMFLPDKNRPVHNQIYMAEAARFAAEKGLDAEQTWRSWLFGPSKLFLGEMEHRFNARMISDIRELGSKAIISTTNSFGGMTIAGLPSLADGGIVAMNIYANGGVLEADPRHAPNVASWASAAAMAGKPFAITEWNMDKHPSHERVALPAYVAALASFQDWNAPMEYGYYQSRLENPGRLTQFEFAIDPTLLAMMPAGALIFRQQHVKPGPSVNYLRPTPAEFIDAALSPVTSRAIRTLTEARRWRLALPALKELDWFKPVAAGQGENLITDMAADFSGGGDTVCAETGDFCRNWRRGIFTVDTPKTQLVSGWIGGESIALTNARVSLKTPYAAVAVQSLDSKPVKESRSILVSMAAQSFSARGDGTAIRSEPIIGEVAFKARPGLVAYAKFGNGRQKQIQVAYVDGSYRLSLDASLGTYWVAFQDAP